MKGELYPTKNLLCLGGGLSFAWIAASNELTFFFCSLANTSTDSSI